MRSSQWFVLGGAFYILAMILANISLQASAFCNYNFENSISCVRQQVFSVFPYVFFLLGSVCFINGAIESYSKKKETEERYKKAFSDGKDKEFVAKMARKFKLKNLPQNVFELVHWGKIEGKEKGIDKEISKYVKEELDGLERRYK